MVLAGNNKTHKLRIRGKIHNFIDSDSIESDTNTVRRLRECRFALYQAIAVDVLLPYAMLIRLVYASRSCDSTAQHLPDIVDWSRRVNPSLGVTGVLCFLDGVYMQYLEGEESIVDALFKSIQADTRHQGITQLERRAISQRAFPDWALAVLDWNDNTRAIFRSFSPEAKFDLFAADPSTAAPLLRALTRSPDWKLI